MKTLKSRTAQRSSEACCADTPYIIGEETFDFPDPPERIPEWADKQADKWRSLSLFDIETLAEEETGLQVEIRAVDFPESVWGLHIVRGERARLCVNKNLPDIWRRFAVFHELHHLLTHTNGEYFWRQTFQPLSRFESEADHFAWAAIWPEWCEGY